MTRQIISALLFFVVASCGHRDPYSKTNLSTARLINKTISLYNYIDNTDSCKKAIQLLDSASAIDTNCFLCFYNKLTFLIALKQYDKGIATVNHLLKTRPYANDLLITGGAFYDKLGDSTSANQYFQRSLAICESALDTMDIKNKAYTTISINRALNLIILGNSKKGNDLLAQLQKEQGDSTYRDYIGSFMNKTREELETLSEDKYSR